MISSRFRKHPERGASGKVSILGPMRCTVPRMAAYAARRNSKAPDVAGLYVEKAARYGIRGDLAFCQAMLDTRAWTAVPSGPPWRPYAHTIWGGMDTASREAELESRTELHLQFLYAFASGRPLEELSSLPDNKMYDMERAGLVGSAPCWEDLNGKWLIPGTRYGQDIVAIWRNMMEWEGDGEKVPAFEEEKNSSPGGWDGRSAPAAAEEHARAREDMAWLATRGLLPSPSPDPDREVTWAELARLIRVWENSAK